MLLALIARFPWNIVILKFLLPSLSQSSNTVKISCPQVHDITLNTLKNTFIYKHKPVTIKYYLGIHRG